MSDAFMRRRGGKRIPPPKYALINIFQSSEGGNFNVLYLMDIGTLQTLKSTRLDSRSCSKYEVDRAHCRVLVLKSVDTDISEDSFRTDWYWAFATRVGANLSALSEFGQAYGDYNTFGRIALDQRTGDVALSGGTSSTEVDHVLDGYYSYGDRYYRKKWSFPAKGREPYTPIAMTRDYVITSQKVLSRETGAEVASHYKIGLGGSLRAASSDGNTLVFETRYKAPGDLNYSYGVDFCVVDPGSKTIKTVRSIGYGQGSCSAAAWYLNGKFYCVGVLQSGGKYGMYTIDRDFRTDPVYLPKYESMPSIHDLHPDGSFLSTEQWGTSERNFNRLIYYNKQMQKVFSQPATQIVPSIGYKTNYTIENSKFI